MDFMKAFDKVPHTRLLEKMKAYGLSEEICIWVQYFSKNVRVICEKKYIRFYPFWQIIDENCK
jgi:hypothetical protein